MDLYSLPPEQFTAARDGAVREARQAGDKPAAAALAALRRPTVPAFAVNALVRAEPALIEQLLELGAQLAAAQGAGEGDALRELGAQRRRLVEAVADRAEAAAGRHLAAAPRAEVVGTLEAALADPASAEAVRSGRLVRALSYAGLGAVDLAGAVAAPPAAQAAAGREHQAQEAQRAQRAQEAQEAQRTRRAEADRAALEAAGALDDAVRAAERAAQEQADADEAVARGAERVAAAEQELVRAREDRDAAAARQRRAGRALQRAHAAVAGAQTAAERTRAALARLDEGDR